MLGVFVFVWVKNVYEGILVVGFECLSHRGSCLSWFFIYI